MNKMKITAIFYGKITLFAVSIIAIAFFVIMPQYSNVFNASLVDKYERLKSIQEPRIILVGGSNVAFGINSAKIEDAFSMPVVNFGVHGHMGPFFLADLIKKHINKGDIIVIMPESYSAKREIYDCMHVWLAVENNMELWADIDVTYYWDLAKMYPTYFKRALELWVANRGNGILNNWYDRTTFNKYGDVIFPRPHNIMDIAVIPDGRFRAQTLSLDMEKYCNEYGEYAQKRNANVYMSCPPVLEEWLSVDLELLQDNLEGRLDIPMISELSDYVYPIEYFFDSGFHLNDFGKEVRTDQLISDLKKVIK